MLLQLHQVQKALETLFLRQQSVIQHAEDLTAQKLQSTRETYESRINLLEEEVTALRQSCPGA